MRPAALATMAGQEASSRPALTLRRLSIGNFRSYAALRFEVEPRPVVLIGANGAGKTNLLEAISFLSPGRGLRQARLSEVSLLGGAAPWTVAASLRSDETPLEIGTGLAPLDAGKSAERRLVRLDGEAVGPGQLARVVGLSWITPQMDRLFIEGGSGRRRFLDRLVLGQDPDHGRRASAYEKAMRERSKLLKMGQADRHWLDALESTMAEQGVMVARARLLGLQRLNQALAAAGPFPRAGLDVAGLVEDWLALAGEDADPAPIIARFRAHLAAARGADGAAGAALLGPHRSDFLVRHLAKDMPAGLCSTGEQKALLIAIVLANARLQTEDRGLAPLLLLDEVAAHLDPLRREALFDEITALGAQAWMSGTDAQLFTALGDRAQFFTVRDGRLFG